jgi:hypothetical protein
MPLLWNSTLDESITPNAQPPVAARVRISVVVALLFLALCSLSA